MTGHLDLTEAEVDVRLTRLRPEVKARLLGVINVAIGLDHPEKRALDRALRTLAVSIEETGQRPPEDLPPGFETEAERDTARAAIDALLYLYWSIDLAAQGLNRHLTEQERADVLAYLGVGSARITDTEESR